MNFLQSEAGRKKNLQIFLSDNINFAPNTSDATSKCSVRFTIIENLLERRRS